MQAVFGRHMLKYRQKQVVGQNLIVKLLKKRFERVHSACPFIKGGYWFIGVFHILILGK
jgi:hypothetical protein